jgi:putative membrane protein
MRKSLLALATATALFVAVANANPNAGKPAMNKDAQALATLVAVDQHEVATAKQALGKGVSGGVRDFATKMQAEHGQNLDDTRRVARENKLPLASSAEVRALEAKGRSEEQSLAKLSGDAYSKAYVDAMVKGHAEVLDKLDKSLIPGAADPEVVAHLKATRGHVAEHLEAAKKLQ